MWKKLFFTAVFTLVPLTAQIKVSGTVSDQNNRPVFSATVKIEPANPALAQKTATDANGVFAVSFDLPAGKFYLSVDADGFQTTRREPIYLTESPNEIRVTLAPVEIFSIDVRPEPDKNQIDIKQMAVSKSLDQETIESSAAPSFDRLEGVLASMPQTTKDARGNLHPAGAANDHINFLLDRVFRISDPVTGQREFQLSNEAPESVTMELSRYSVDLGRGVVPIIIYGGMGDDKPRRQATDFFPGIETTKGLAISDFKPRLTLSGPVKRSRIWYFNALNTNYNQNIIYELPKGQDRVSSWDINNLSRFQANLTQKNVLTGSFGYNYYNAPNTGLGVLDPLETTIDKQARRKLLTLQDQFFTHNGTLTIGYGWYDSFSRETPQGREIYQIRPSGRSGNGIADIKRRANRHQLAANILWRKINYGSQNHELKTGFDFNRSNLCRDTARTGYQHFRLDGTPSSLVTFGGNGRFCRSLFEQAWYVQDHWSLKTWLHIEGGLRFDKDNIVGSGALTPRVGLTAMPPHFGGIKFSAGYGLMPAMTHLGIFTQKYDQYSTEVMFDKSGTPIGQPQLRIFTSNESQMTLPTISNLSFGVEKELPGNLRLKANVMRKRGKNGFTFTPRPGDRTDLIPLNLGPLPLPIGAIWNLENSRIETYDAFNIAIEKRFRQSFIDQPLLRKFRQDELSCNYTRSQSSSNSNLNPFIDDPITFMDTAGRTPWDVPNQIKCRGVTEFGTTKIGNYAAHRLLYFAEWRDGLPFSVHDDEGHQIGQFNGWRLSRYFTLNIHLEKKLRLRHDSKHIWAIRLGVNNILGRPNYNSVNQNISAPGFPNYYDREPRKLVVHLHLIRN